MPNHVYKYSSKELTYKLDNRDTSQPGNDHQDWIVGKNAVHEAILGNLKVEKLILCADIPPMRRRKWEILAASKGIVWQTAPRIWFDKLTPLKKHQGIAARISQIKDTEIDAMLNTAKAQNRLPLLLMLDGIQDPYNLGAILRTSLGVGIHGVILPKRRTAGLTSAAIATSSGAAYHVSIARVNNLGQEIAKLKKQQFWVIGADPKAQDTYENISQHKVPIIILMSGEGHGLRPSLKNACDYLYSIPMQQPLNSLNVSVATALFLYTAFKR